MYLIVHVTVSCTYSCNPPAQNYSSKLGPEQLHSYLYGLAQVRCACVFVEQLEIPSDAFRKNSVNGEDLLELSDTDLIQELAIIVNVGMSSSISNKFLLNRYKSLDQLKEDDCKERDRLQRNERELGMKQYNQM